MIWVIFAVLAVAFVVIMGVVTYEPPQQTRLMGLEHVWVCDRCGRYGGRKIAPPVLWEWVGVVGVDYPRLWCTSCVRKGFTRLYK
jgi:hypothetical protein